MSKSEIIADVADIGAHGAIGNMRAVALVSTAGTVDYLCHPNLDSPSVFCALLDPERGGSFAIAPDTTSEWRTRQIYIPDTNVLITRFMDGASVLEITDYMPIMAKDGPRSALMRRVACVKGEVDIQMRCAPRYDYGRDGPPGVTLAGDAAVFAPNEAAVATLRLRANVPLVQGRGEATARFRLAEGRRASFVLECNDERPSGADELEDHLRAAFDETIAYWQSWSAHSSYKGRWREHVMRSGLVLKLLTSAEHGSIAAAATFGLPEKIGGSRNWDYRFCWIRDAAFATFALMRLGYVGEAKRFNEWVSARADTSEAGEFQILYRLDGSSEAEEQTLDHLAGYRGSTPVRIGNGAAQQLQLDIYGALFDSGYLADKYGESVTYGAWERILRTANWVCRNWDQADEGIWEIRGARQHFLSSRLMCWVALDRGLRLLRKRSLPAGHAAEWETNRDLIYRDIHDNFWNEERGAFMQYKGGAKLDASALLMPLMRFIAPHDPRWLSTQDAIERELTSDVLVRRYESGDGDDNVDGLAGDEGAFTPCSFWLVECLARSGKVRRARLHFEKLLSYSNELGLFAEEIGPGGDQIGNIPQALSHLALISAAYTLDSALDRKGPPTDSWRQF